ncbi:putative endo-1,4-beta-xylanase [Helianthus debilis subsp. tardiflorus]
MRRHSGKVIAWDVLNENLHFNFFESKLGWTTSSKFYATARALDRTADLFLNDLTLSNHLGTKRLLLIVTYQKSDRFGQGRQLIHSSQITIFPYLTSV